MFWSDWIVGETFKELGSQMSSPAENTTPKDCWETLIGYLNFSSGTFDPQLYRALNQIFSQFHAEPANGNDFSKWLGISVKTKLVQLQLTNPAFADVEQADQVSNLIFDKLLPGYLEYHSDLLFHQTSSFLFNPFFIGRCMEVVLQQPGPWTETDRIVRASLKRLNDFVGHRPVPVLEGKRVEPNPHERVRPIPLFIKGVGVARGPYAEIVEQAIEVLKKASPDVLFAAHFDLDKLDEISLDPRAYDFDHPVNRRPNYHFGQWDPHLIDNHGYYRRFVVQQVTIDALASRLQNEQEIAKSELLVEAAAVLAGTMLMGAAISGRGPDAYDSTTSLVGLLPIIAKFRDRFYEELIEKMDGAHGTRLRLEARRKRQAFGGARQHINSEIARRRAIQMMHVHLANIYARMGYLKEAIDEANVVPVTSARMVSLIDCSLFSAHRALDERKLDIAKRELQQAVTTLRRGIACGAIIDPWNILGFDSQFQIFQGTENSSHDHRADDLVNLIDEIFELCRRIWSVASARDDAETASWIASYFEELANWWHKFATHEVSSVSSADAIQSYESSRHVANCLSLWQKGGAAAGDVAFWAKHANLFDSPKAYASVIQALLDQRDHVASRALLVHWISRCDDIPLYQGNKNVFSLLEQWAMEQLEITDKSGGDLAALREIWSRMQRLVDQIEANADSIWKVPKFELKSSEKKPSSNPPKTTERLEQDEEQDEEVSSAEIFNAAYEDVVYEDSTDDGMEASVFDSSLNSSVAESLEEEVNRISLAVTFHACLARLLRAGAVVVSRTLEFSESEFAGDRPIGSRVDSLRHWCEILESHQNQLMNLIVQVQDFGLAAPKGDHDSMVEYGRLRLLKENLLETIIVVMTEIEDGSRFVLGAESALRTKLEQKPIHEVQKFTEESLQITELIAAVLLRDIDRVPELFDEFAAKLTSYPLLYVPLVKGGDARTIVRSRIRRNTIQDLLVSLPRLGLLRETYAMLETARAMEQKNPVGSGAVTEFDELFRLGYRAAAECILNWAEKWEPLTEETTFGERPISTDEDRLYAASEKLAETLLMTWLEHSKTLRLSVMEKVRDDESWNGLVKFIKKYGGEIFSQRFFNLGNLRAILHQGVENWLRQLEELPNVELNLITDLDRSIPRSEAVRHLTLILEATIENFSEYRDYNSTTTQSDRGEMLYTFLDFLRLRSQYDRVNWKLRPIFWSHEILVRHGKDNVARRWRRAVRDRIGDEPKQYLEKLERLQKKHAMLMPSIADRIGEQFIMPMRIDRIRAFVRPAMQNENPADRRKAFEYLQLEAKLLAQEPRGSGFELPRWVSSLEEEVESVQQKTDWDTRIREAIVPAPIQLSDQELFDRLDAANE